MTRGRNPRITSIGEALVDFVAMEQGRLESVQSFDKNLGGEGANVAVGLARLGARVAFVGTVGADPFGDFLLERMKRERVDSRAMRKVRGFRTRLAFVSLTKSGERNFAFWEMNPAGAQLRARAIPAAVLRHSAIINIAPLLLINEPSRTTVLGLARRLFSTRRLVAFDPNLRPSLWRSAGEMKRVANEMITSTTILRLNEDEARTLTGKRPIVAARHFLQRGVSLVVITKGEKGCYFCNRAGEGEVPGYSVLPVDTTGCGDAFLAALLHGIAEGGCHPSEMTPEQLTSICVHANAVGALTSLKRGGADAMPRPDEILSFMQERAWPAN